MHIIMFTWLLIGIVSDHMLTNVPWFNTKKVRLLAYEIAVQNKLEMCEKWRENKHTGEYWLKPLHWHVPVLLICTTSMHILMYEPLIEKINVGGRVIYNLDESGCRTVQCVPKVISVAERWNNTDSVHPQTQSPVAVFTGLQVG